MPPRFNKRKLSSAIQLALLSGTALAPMTVMSDVQLDEGGGRGATAATSISNSADIAPAADWLLVDGTNSQITGGVTNSGSITAGSDGVSVFSSSTISGGIVNDGTITADDDAFHVDTS